MWSWSRGRRNRLAVSLVLCQIAGRARERMVVKTEREGLWDGQNRPDAAEPGISASCSRVRGGGVRPAHVSDPPHGQKNPGNIRQGTRRVYSCHAAPYFLAQRLSSRN